MLRRPRQETAGNNGGPGAQAEPHQEEDARKASAVDGMTRNVSRLERWDEIVERLDEATARFDEVVWDLQVIHAEIQRMEKDEDPAVQEKLRESLVPIRAAAQRAGLEACEEAAIARRRALMNRRRQEEKKRRAREEARAKREREQQELLATLRRKEEAFRRDAERTERKLANLRKDQLFEELDAQRAANKEREWEAHPERFYCYVCKLPGVRQARKCPRKDQHYKFL